MTSFVKAFYINMLSIEWNFIRLGGPTHGIVTKTVHNTLPGCGGGGRGLGVVGVHEVVGVQGVVEWGSV